MKYANYRWHGAIVVWGTLKSFKNMFLMTRGSAEGATLHSMDDILMSKLRFGRVLMWMTDLKCDRVS